MFIASAFKASRYCSTSKIFYQECKCSIKKSIDLSVQKHLVHKHPDNFEKKKHKVKNRSVKLKHKVDQGQRASRDTDQGQRASRDTDQGRRAEVLQSSSLRAGSQACDAARILMCFVLAGRLFWLLSAAARCWVYGIRKKLFRQEFIKKYVGVISYSYFD